MNNLQAAYLTMQNACGIKVGDKVKVLRKAERYEMGWNNGWVDDMDNTIGQVFIVKNIDNCGIILKKRFDRRFPFFVLEKIEDAPTEDPIINFINNKCNFDCQQENVKKIVEMLLERIDKCAQ